ncbi:MAG: TniQ family protein [Rudaea sp.]|nr:TniQ family protein [Rudaea sp.]
MSWLLPLPIRGAGTSHVEALSSYLLRLARVHAITSGKFLSSIVERYCWPDAPRRAGILQSRISTLIRPNDTTQLILESLASGLSVPVPDIEQTTFLALGSALCRPMKAFSSCLRWCPACLSEQMRNCGEPYFELAWQVLTVETCEVHGVCLHDHCGSCGRIQDGYLARRSLAECIHCKARLDKTTLSDISRDFYAENIRSVVGYIATHPGIRFPQHGVSDVLRRLLDEPWEDCSEEVLYILPRDACVRFADPTEPLTLISALRIAFWLNVPLVDLLLGRLQGTNKSILRGMKEALPDVIAPQRRRRIRSIQVLANEATRIIETASEALSLTEVARKLGVSAGALRYHLPKQSSEIIQTYQLSRRRRRASTSTQCRSNVRKTIARWSQVEDRPFSKKALLSSVRARTGLPKNLLREEIKRQTESSTTNIAM